MALDYQVDPESMRSTIDGIKTANQEISASSEDLRNIIKNSLVGGGMDGEVAEQLAEAYDREVLSAAREFGDTVQNQVQVNEDNLSRYETMQEESSAIAGR